MIIITLLAFIFSFLFALGGVGSAIVLVPIMYWLGIPLSEAKPTGLFINTISLIGATYSNIKNKRLDIKIGIPIIVASIILAPIGAYFSTIIPKKVVLLIFISFLIFSSFMMLFFRASKYESNYREDPPYIELTFTGSLAGFISGLLGVGGGGLISPLMIMLGFNPKKVAKVTAFVVPFSSITGFFAYLAMGHINIKLLTFVGLAAYLGGYLDTHLMHLKMKPATVKKFLGIILLILAIKLLIKIF
ncbi:sulfite exporter TauE/SafE family protein [Deferribacter thermophilus]|uniref:sulfite exporter TauE/SafE family protein n=1 Tax=Deferribacter thermophilus TaxID=53573 RepID=UPI003C27FD1A